MRILKDIANFLNPKNLIKPRNWLNLIFVGLAVTLTVQLVRLHPDGEAVERLIDLKQAILDAEARHAELLREIENARSCSIAVGENQEKLVTTIQALEKMLVAENVLAEGETLEPGELESEKITLNSGEVLEGVKISSIGPSGLIVTFDGGIRQVRFSELPRPFIAFLGIPQS